MRVPKAPARGAAGVAIASKHMESRQGPLANSEGAENGVALVRAGAIFEKGKLVERPDESGGEELVA